jgi:hypothetical protein
LFAGVERGRRGGGGAKTYDSEKAWSSINNSILFDYYSRGLKKI